MRRVRRRACCAQIQLFGEQGQARGCFLERALGRGEFLGVALAKLPRGGCGRVPWGGFACRPPAGAGLFAFPRRGADLGGERRERQENMWMCGTRRRAVGGESVGSVRSFFGGACAQAILFGTTAGMCTNWAVGGYRAISTFLWAGFQLFFRGVFAFLEERAVDIRDNGGLGKIN
jgi:hypothetical protein